jgi:hypothetical protein
MPVPWSRVASCAAELDADAAAISDCAGGAIAVIAENSRTLDYSGGLRGLCCGERFAVEMEVE